MATLTKTKNGAYYIQLAPGEHPKRPKISLGRCQQKEADHVFGHVQNLLKAKKLNLEVSAMSDSEAIRATAKWIDGLPEPQRKRLEQIDLMSGGFKSPAQTCRDITFAVNRRIYLNLCKYRELKLRYQRATGGNFDPDASRWKPYR